MRVRGTVQWFNPEKGYGFISPDFNPEVDTIPESVFVHYTAVESPGRKTLEDNDTVEFEIKEGPKGPQAACVKRVSN